ncbi:hypothetical protein COCHEDRAFT_1021955 [Bipolaris maydis C5]|uniref:Uncharacterized protein n=1 Tax=Cochliobolus heterostrophus (strain C5 / ATCC 48332 / race O) TaxID=701091 RepID=M2UP13_COCH5|nr:hypothetical protein COCHEDRAFT_1021955 [Bipolaris maydis C5]
MHAKIKSLSITTIVVRVPNKSSSDDGDGVYREDSFPSTRASGVCWMQERKQVEARGAKTSVDVAIRG